MIRLVKYTNIPLKWTNFHWKILGKKRQDIPWIRQNNKGQGKTVDAVPVGIRKQPKVGEKMTDKEFKRLKRADLIEIIYRLQENEEKYRETIAKMGRKLEEKQTKIENAGSIAEAAMALSNVFDAAQEAADRYLADIVRMHREAEQELETARKEAARITETARRNAAGWSSRGEN